MKHYICTGGCGAVSDKPGVCQAVECPNHGHAFVECNCTDGKHYDFKACVNCGKMCAREGGCEMEAINQ